MTRSPNSRAATVAGLACLAALSGCSSVESLVAGDKIDYRSTSTRTSGHVTSTATTAAHPAASMVHDPVRTASTIPMISVGTATTNKASGYTPASDATLRFATIAPRRRWYEILRCVYYMECSAPARNESMLSLP